MDKKSFVVYYEIKETLDELTDEQAGRLFKAMVDYEMTGTEPNFDGVLKFVWIPIRQALTRDGAKYQDMVEKRRSAGRKGGLASGEARRSKSIEISTKTKQNEANEANQADNVNVNVNVNDNVNDNDNVSVNVNDSVCGPHPDEDTRHDFSDDDDVLTFGVLDNVRLTQAQYDSIHRTYQQPRRLIDKVSSWLPEAKHPPADHFALVHRFAVNDSWPKKPEPERPPDVIEEDVEYVPAPAEVRKKLKSIGLEVL